MRLNDAQQQAVTYIDGPCLVLAGAGSGKTRVITAKIVNLITGHKLPAKTVCAVTFTNKAAAEMRERVAHELGQDCAKEIWISTFHSLGLGILRIEHNKVGLKRNFTLFDESDQFKIVRDLIREKYPLMLDGKAERDCIFDALQQISLWKGELRAPQDISPKTTLSSLYEEYQTYLKACNAADFDDLIFLTTKLLKSDPETASKWENYFRYVLVDEYQDTNTTQYELLKVLVSKRRRFTVVGDDDQSIYSWRGARPENINILAHDFPDLKVIKLEQNYRSSGRILHCANKIIENNEHLFKKSLFSNLDEGKKIAVIEVQDENAESERVASEILKHRYLYRKPWRDYAVLYRSNTQSRSIEKAFRSARIPCVITGGSSFFDMMEVKDILAWCRLLSNEGDNAALLRIINIPRRGIGAETLSTIASVASEYSVNLYTALRSKQLYAKLSSGQNKSITSFLELYNSLKNLLKAHQDLQLAQKLIDIIGYEGYLRGTGANDKSVEVKIKNVRTLMSWIEDLVKGRRGEPPLLFSQAVDKLGLREMMDKNEDGSENDAVQLMTLHSAKGLEFPYVFLIGMEEGILPHRNSLDMPNGIEEERRLAYVGVTRAKVELTITYCRERKKGREATANEPSRFIAEMPQEDLAREFLGAPKKIDKEESAMMLDRGLDMLKGLL